MTAPAALTEPIEIEKFWKTRRRDKAIVVSLSSYEGINIVNVREHLTGADGCMRPTTKGIAMAVRRLPQLAAGITKALAKARELGLIDDDAKVDA
jgi:hypothetical protein